MIKVFGLRNCDTCRNALKWLENLGFMHEFYDIRDKDIVADAIVQWTSAVGWSSLLNTRSTSWRGLPDEKKVIANEQGAMKLMLETPTLIKRPVFEAGNQVIVGFKDVQRTALEQQRGRLRCR